MIVLYWTISDKLIGQPPFSRLTKNWSSAVLKREPLYRCYEVLSNLCTTHRRLNPKCITQTRGFLLPARIMTHSSPNFPLCLRVTENTISPIWDNQGSVTWKWQHIILPRILTARRLWCHYRLINFHSKWLPLNLFPCGENCSIAPAQQIMYSHDIGDS